MRNLNRILIPLLLSVLVFALLIMAGCRSATGGNAAGETSEEPEAVEKAEIEQHYEFLTEVELETDETPIMLLPQEEQDKVYNATGNGAKKSIDLTADGTAPAEILSVTVDGKEVKDFKYDSETGVLELTEAPKEGTKIQVTTHGSRKPATSTTKANEENSDETPATSSTAPTWTGAPETPIIPYRAPATTTQPEEDTND